MLSGINLKEKYKIFSSPKTDVEHRTAHNADHAVLNVFETRRNAFQFDLVFDHPVVVSMIQGKKVMHLKSKDPFEFLPGETVVMPSSELMYIDFPEATQELPTQCMALEISEGFVRQTLALLNEHFPKVDNGSWTWTKENFHLLNNARVHQDLNRLVRVMVDNDWARHLRATNTTRELIASLLQTQARHFLLSNLDALATRNRLAHVVRYIRENITRDISVCELAEQACLSRAQFFRSFQRELGESPVKFINRERIRIAKRALLMNSSSLSHACSMAGFSSENYFSRVFRQVEGVSPTVWLRQKAMGMTV
jgi:AraC-like DNA-binding protein